MHLKKRSSGAAIVSRANARGVAEALLGTDQKGQNSLYDTRSGTFLTTILLFVLGWIPMIGQMVAGFVGGRRAGSPLRGFIAVFFGTIITLLIMFLTVEGLNAINSALISDPEGEIAFIAASHPVLQQLLDGALGYSRALFGHSDFTIDYGMYMITIPFGIIGGIFANQAQKEARIIVSRTAKASARRIRSLDAFKSGKPMGFETFEHYTAMSVNSMATPMSVNSMKKEEPQQQPAAKPKRTIVRTKESPVSATVDRSRVQSSPTSSSTSSARKRQEPAENESTVYI